MFMWLRPHQWVRGRWPWGYGGALSIIIMLCLKRVLLSCAKVVMVLWFYVHAKCKKQTVNSTSLVASYMPKKSSTLLCQTS